jgi:hypothetical protein
MNRRLAIALVHYPVLAKNGEVVTAALTNLDVHDLARSARTYGCTDYFIVHPILAQRTLATKIVSHWTHGSSAKRIPTRQEALSLVRPVHALEDAVSALEGAGNDQVTIWATAARSVGKTIDFSVARRAMGEPGGPILLIFGTGWGLGPSILASAHAVLAPIRGPGSWNHLSVRAACAIVLDRLCAL